MWEIKSSNFIIAGSKIKGVLTSKGKTELQVVLTLSLSNIYQDVDLKNS